MDERTQFDLSNRLFTLIIVFLVAVVAVGGTIAYAAWQSANWENDTITVDGEGKAYLAPDIAKVNIGVKTDADTSAEAAEEGTNTMKAVIEAVQETGVVDKDIQTANYFLNPKYRWDPDDGEQEDGYTFTQSVNIRIRDFEKLSDVLAAATSAGANSIGNVVFDIEDKNAVIAEARTKAIADAKAKAAKIQDETGLDLGKVVNFWESESGKGGPYYYEESAVMMDAGGRGGANAALPAPSIQPGEQEIVLHVSLTYKID